MAISNMLSGNVRFRKTEKFRFAFITHIFFDGPSKLSKSGEQSDVCRIFSFSHSQKRLSLLLFRHTIITIWCFVGDENVRTKKQFIPTNEEQKKNSFSRPMAASFLPYFSFFFLPIFSYSLNFSFALLTGSLTSLLARIENMRAHTNKIETRRQ